MRKPRDPWVFYMWCLVGALGLLGLAVALLSLAWNTGQP